MSGHLIGTRLRRSLTWIPLLLLAVGARAEVTPLSVSRLKAAKLPLVTLTVNDPVYRDRRTYEGYWLHDVLRLEGVLERPADELSLRCEDGYAPALPWSEIRPGRGLLAIREKGRRGDWEPIRQGKKTLKPAPFYLVWAEGDAKLPWPYQLVAVEPVSFANKYGEIYPVDVSAGASVRRGFELYRQECMKCHSINLRGGELGPELNYPRNITEYRDDRTLRAFIRDPAAFRARSPMPGFPQFSDVQVGDLLGYLRWVRDRKKAPESP
jgi:mono/diheme cytochrome c family protein